MKDKNNKLSVIDNTVVCKEIKRDFSIKHIPAIQKKIYDAGILCPQILRYYIHNAKHISYEYYFIDGVIEKEITSYHIEYVINEIIKKIENIDVYQLGHITSFYDKINCYIDNIALLELNKYYQNLYEYLKKRFENISCQFPCVHIMHGDIDMSNLVWKNHTGYLIDFDECCLGPKGMDVAIFMIRLLGAKKQGRIEMRDEVSHIAEYIENHMELMEIYVIKVVLEKVYLLCKEIIDEREQEQKKDSLEFWMKILKNYL